MTCLTDVKALRITQTSYVACARMREYKENLLRGVQRFGWLHRVCHPEVLEKKAQERSLQTMADDLQARVASERARLSVSGSCRLVARDGRQRSDDHRWGFRAAR